MEKEERIEFLKSRIQALKDDIDIFWACSEDLQRLSKYRNELKDLEATHDTTITEWVGLLQDSSMLK